MMPLHFGPHSQPFLAEHGRPALGPLGHVVIHINIQENDAQHYIYIMLNVYHTLW